MLINLKKAMETATALRYTCGTVIGKWSSYSYFGLMSEMKETFLSNRVLFVIKRRVCLMI
jgi:hypothetical protein